MVGRLQFSRWHTACRHCPTSSVARSSPSGTFLLNQPGRNVGLGAFSQWASGAGDLRSRTHSRAARTGGPRRPTRHTRARPLFLTPGWARDRRGASWKLRCATWITQTRACEARGCQRRTRLVDLVGAAHGAGADRSTAGVCANLNPPRLVGGEVATRPTRERRSVGERGGDSLSLSSRRYNGAHHTQRIDDTRHPKEPARSLQK